MVIYDCVVTVILCGQFVVMLFFVVVGSLCHCVVTIVVWSIHGCVVSVLLCGLSMVVWSYCGCVVSLWI